TLSVSGTTFLFEIGARMRDESGNPDAPVDVVLCSDSRKPDAKHQILEMYAEHGFELPDTPMMALHRGRIDLLEAHVRRDPALLGSRDRKSTRLNSSHVAISYAVFCLKKKKRI